MLRTAVRHARSGRLPLLLSLPLLLANTAPESSGERGRRLFAGEQAVEARMVGHTDPLPAEAYRCVNCHSSSSTPPRTDLDFAPVLSKLTLTTRIARRGGPPSAYEPTSFCRLVRDGVDPAHVMISQAMPRYRLSDRECEALWTYLMR